MRKSVKIFKDLTGNRTHDLSACSAVPEVLYIIYLYYILYCVYVSVYFACLFLPHLRLVLNVRMGGATPPLPFFAFMDKFTCTVSLICIPVYHGNYTDNLSSFNVRSSGILNSKPRIIRVQSYSCISQIHIYRCLLSRTERYDTAEQESLPPSVLHAG
jgi:hypothetical protein